MLREKVESLCKEHGIAVARLEKECGIGNATIRKWDKSTPNLATLKKVADYFEVPLCELVKEYEDG